MRLRLPLLAAAALLGTVPPASAEYCGSYPDENNDWTLGQIQGAGIYDVRATEGIGCRTARRVALNAYRHNTAGARAWTYKGYWRCKEVARGYEYVRVRCFTPSGRRVRWEAGA